MTDAARRIICLQHVSFELPGAIGQWATDHGFRMETVPLYQNARPGKPGPDDLLVVLGGPMGVGDQDRYAWLAAEKRFIKKQLDRGVAVLGLCLGAQLLADCLGALVTANPEREIGWHPVERVGDSVVASLFPARYLPFHWHGQTFALPDGAVRIATSAGCLNQAFAMGECVIGLQFHLETTAHLVAGMCNGCPGDLAPGPYVQSRDDMLAEPRRFSEAHALLDRVLSQLAGTSG